MKRGARIQFLRVARQAGPDGANPVFLNMKCHVWILRRTGRNVHSPTTKSRMITPSGSLSPTKAIIDLPAFRSNLAAVRSYIGPGVKIMAIVKAQAYGHGAAIIAKEAVRTGVEYLGVARVEEGIELRRMEIASPILVFEVASTPACESAVLENLDLTVATVGAAQELDAIASRLGRKAKVHVKVDTGMGRLGFPATVAVDGVEAVARLRHIELVGVYSHFATSEEPDQSFAKEQLARFHRLLEELSRRRIDVPLTHMANSGAIISLPDSHFDMVRPGIMLYGYPPARSMEQTYPVSPVLSLLSTVGFIKTLEPGTSVSYGRKYRTNKKTTIVTIPIGYADGYVRSLTNRTEVIIRGKRYPAVGTICMDQLMVDIGDGSGCAVGDDVTLIGTDGDESITCWDLAATVGTIPYEITCLIPARVPRLARG